MLITGIGIVVLFILVGVHCLAFRYRKTRIFICLCIAIGLCCLRTMHTVLIGLGVFFGECIIVFIECTIIKILKILGIFDEIQENIDDIVKELKQ